MNLGLHLFKTEQPHQRPFALADGIVLVALAILVYGGLRLGLRAPSRVLASEISLSPAALPWYAGLSLARMVAAYILSLLFSLAYGYVAAYHRRAELILLPVLDVLQSVPILSFLPVVLLGLSAVLSEGIAAELASIVLIFTSQAWNLTFSWYQSLTTIPAELREVSISFGFSRGLRFRTLELPFAAIGLIWNSMMSWAGGWFFLMAAETFSVGARDFRLPGLGAYLQEAARRGDIRAILWGLGTLVLVIVVLDQLVWRPLLAWGARFKLEMVEGERPPSSWFYQAVRRARLPAWLSRSVVKPAMTRLERGVSRRNSIAGPPRGKKNSGRLLPFLGLLAGCGLVYGSYRALVMLFLVSPNRWREVATGLAFTLLRVIAALGIAMAWTIPAGVLVGSKARLSAWAQPVVQILASVPATALFPVFVMLLVRLPGGLNLAAVLLMLMGTQWYVLFNVVSGVSAIPQDLKYTSALLQLRPWDRWRTLFLPALFPYLITGAITASGGAWNASIIAEYVQLGDKTVHTPGIGSLIAQATAGGDYPLLLAATLSLVFAVVLINRLIWRRLYRLAEGRYRLE